MKTKTQFMNRILSLVLSIMMVVSMLPMNVLTASAAETTESAIDLSTLTETYLISDSGEYTFTGSGSYGIKVESGNPTIVLNDASITVGEGSSIDVASGSNATIFVLGDNTIGTTNTESWDALCGGIFVAEGGTVNITSNGTDNILRAHGTLAAAIGGKYDYDNNESYNAGSINISNVTVYAYTNNFYAAAIGAAGEGTCGTINITNAVVYAYGAGDKWTSSPGIGNAWSLLDWSDTIPIVIISDSEVHTFRYNPYSDYIGYLGDESGDTYATGSINCGDGGSIKNSTIYCYTGLTATTTDKVIKYGALGGLLKEDGTCEGEHSGGTQTCMGYKCANCANWYGEKNENHDWSGKDGICTNGCGTTHDHAEDDWNNGICTICDTYQPATLVTNENYESFNLKADYVGYYAISNAGQLFWFAQQVNEEGNKEIKGVLTADIELEKRPWTPIGAMGEENSFRGIFDGQNYNIWGLYVEGSENGVGFFGEVRTGTVKNFRIYGNVVVNTEVDYVGGVIGSICGVNGETDLERNGAIVQNITSNVNITVKAHGVGTIGGLVGHADHQSLIELCVWNGTFNAGSYRVDSGAGGFIGKIQENTGEVTIRNCGAYGTIKTGYEKNSYNNYATIYMGGFLSFSNTGAKTTLENCLFAGKFERGANLTDAAELAAFGTLRSVNAIKNCYYLGDDGLAAVHSDSDLKPGSDNVEIISVTEDDLRNNTIATQLGEYWDQYEDYPRPKDTGSHSHSYTYTDNGDGTHDQVCRACDYVEVDNEAHSGGTATCTEQAECQHCGASYGELADHSTSYSADGMTITYKCATCDTQTVTFTLVIPTGAVYGGALEVPHYDSSDKTYQGDYPEITLDGALLKDFVPGAKTYEVVMTWGGKTVSGEYTIAKADVGITAPTPNTLTYTGEAQYLISAGEAVGGTMVYSLTEDGEYTTSIPQGTNAGDYKVWYYVQGDANYNDSAKDSVAVTIEKATPTAEDFIFTAPTDLIYDGTAKPATITVKDGIVGMGEVNVIYFRDAGMWIDNEREPIYPGRYQVGIWIKEGDNYKAVYSDERIWLGSEFEIKYLTTDAKADISGTMGSNGWYTSDVTLTAPEGYQISKTKYNDGFESKLTISAEKNETITYYLKDANGDVAEKTVELKIDKTAPSAQYQIGTNGWKQFINTITFGLFCKDYKTVDIEYTDELSGVAEKQYYISSDEITDTSSIAWLDYTDTLSLNATGKYLIYMRVVDNAGHEVMLNTEGIVIYEDSVQVTESVSTTYNAGTDKDVTVKLNGNTLNAIKNGNAVLTEGTDYTVSADGTITLKASYLDTLNAGEYTFTVSYNPQGVETDKVNMTTTFTVKVEKADGKVSNLNISGKTYDGTAVTAPTFDKPGDGAATIEYKVRGADDSTYTTTAPKDAGNYVVRVTVAESTNYKAASATTYFAIASAELRDVSVQQVGTLTYTGEALTPAVSANAVAVNNQPITFTYSTESEGPYSTEIPSFTNAGWAHTVYYRATADNHNTHYGSFLVEIEKATVTEPTIASKPYNGSAQTADISGTDLYTVEKNNGGTEKGSYDVVLKLKDSANYKWSTTNNAEVTLQFVISAAQNAWDTNPSISGWPYGEAAKTPVGTAKYGAVKVVYTGKANDGTDYNSETAPTKAGNYTATFTVTGTEDYSGLSEQVNFTIAKKAVTVTANDASKTYGESDPALTYTHTELVGSDALVITVARTSGENANTYTITASQAEGANPNYEITFKTGTFTIHKATLTVTVEDKTATYGDPVPNYTVKYEGFVSGDDKDDLGGALAFECGYAQFSDKGEYTIKASGYTSGNYTISYVDGKLTVNAKPITVTIQNATSVYGDTLAELKATDNGIVNGDTNVYSLATTATGTSNVGKYTITGTALDSNYDVTFVNGEYEITKREITITVDAKNTVFNTTLPTYTYKVEGLVGVDTLVTEPTLTCNANIALIGEYDITASGADAGGNYSIKYVPAKLTVLTDNAVDAAAGYTEELKDYDPATVTSEDKAELEEMLSEINTILADETTTDNGKKALEEVKEQVEKLIKEITDAAEATDTENTEKVENVTPENVTPENKTDLEGAKADLEKALEDNGGNYTEDEKKAIEDEIKRIDDALEVIGNVEAVEKVISKLPAVDTVKPDDEEAIKAITDAQTAYNALSDYEKSLVDEVAKANLDKLVAALVAYDIVEGDGSSWTENSNPNITFVVNGLFSKFVGIKVDGKDVDKANYEVKAGSTIITLKASYLDTLAVGEHTITVVYTDGSTDGTFNVHAKANSPATGDNSNMFLWIALLFISGGAVITLTVVDRKRRSAANK